MKIYRGLITLGVCMVLLVTSVASDTWCVGAKTYEAGDFGLGYDVEEYVGVKFIKITKKYVIYRKYIFDGNDGLKLASKKKYKKRYSKKVKMFVLKRGYPSNWVKVCNGFTYKNINKYKTQNGSEKLKKAYWILKGNNMLELYTP